MNLNRVINFLRVQIKNVRFEFLRFFSRLYGPKPPDLLHSPLLFSLRVIVDVDGKFEIEDEMLRVMDALYV